MTEDEKRIRKRLKEDFIHYASKCLKIRTKEGAVKPLLLNKGQLYAHQKLELQKGQTGKVRAILVKGRQMGFSTYIGARFFHQTIHSFGTKTFILTHALDATNNLFEMAQRFYNNSPHLVQPQVTKSNAKELIFGVLDSGYKLGTAENKSVGRSSTIQMLHASEVAFWNNAAEHAKGILQAVPNANGTEIIMESTANGIGNFFHQQWQAAEAGESEYIPIFIPWYWMDEYQSTIPDGFSITSDEIELKEQYDLTLEQLAWRRLKIAEFSVNGLDGIKSFMQEYPCNSTEAFQQTGDNSYIPPALVMRARKCEVEPYGPKLLGVDPARFGDDRTSMIRRQGRVAYGLQSFSKKDNMEVVGIILQAHQTEQFQKIYIDVGGGAGIIDRLKELGLGDIVVGVNFGSSPLNAERYLNKRSEMWGEMKLWLEDEPCQIPDMDSLHSDLCAPQYTYDSKSRLQMEKKEDMKKRGIRSPDEGDSLALTFAFPAIALDKKKQDTANQVMSKIAQNMQRNSQVRLRRDGLYI